MEGQWRKRGEKDKRMKRRRGEGQKNEEDRRGKDGQRYKKKTEEGRGSKVGE